MLTRPSAISDDQLMAVVQSAWGFDASEVTYHPYGFGSHHWIATGADGARRFLSVDELSEPSDGGIKTPESLRRAFETAHALRHVAQCKFVVAPERSRHGRVLENLGGHHSVALFPFVEGTTGEFTSGHGSASGRAAVVDLLVDLHAATIRVPAGTAADEQLAVAGESPLRLALSELETAWSGGPYSEPAREALQSHDATVRRALEHHVRLAAEVRNSEAGWVLTHGEPHPGNVMSTKHGLRLIDWDTVLLAPPERDLAVVATRSDEELDRYEVASGRVVDPVALEMYRLRWHLAEIAVYVAQFRRPHIASEDVEASWRNLLHYLELEDNLPDLTW